MASSQSTNTISWLKVSEELSYDKKKIIGRGRFGTVFIGSFGANNETVAVKRIQTTDITEVDSIQKEVELLKEASGHRNILGYIHHEIDINFL